MDFKANYEIINDVGAKVYKEAEQLEQDFKDILALIEQLGTCWAGIDYTDFAGYSSAYVKNLSFNVEELKTLAKFIQLASSVYLETDLEWEKKIKEMGERNDWNLG